MIEIEIEIEEAVILALYYRHKHLGKKVPKKILEKVKRIKEKYKLNDNQLMEIALQCWDRWTANNIRFT